MLETEKMAITYRIVPFVYTEFKKITTNLK